MKEAPERVPNRNGLRYSAADKLKTVKLYLEEGYQAKRHRAGTRNREKFPRQMDPGIS